MRLSVVFPGQDVWLRELFLSGRLAHRRPEIWTSLWLLYAKEGRAVCGVLDVTLCKDVCY